jgi:hypothetical protein
VKTERFVEDAARARWGRGPWDDEPDKAEWRYRALPCLIVRNSGGALCGYVGLPPGHPMHGVGYDDVELAPDDDGDTYPRVHGGLTFSDRCHEGGHICHVAGTGEPDDVWWLGFDCSHGGDVRPADAPGSYMEGLYQAHGLGRSSSMGECYRDLSYVRRQVEALADQLLDRMP